MQHLYLLQGKITQSFYLMYINIRTLYIQSKRRIHNHYIDNQKKKTIINICSKLNQILDYATGPQDITTATFTRVNTSPLFNFTFTTQMHYLVAIPIFSY